MKKLFWLVLILVGVSTLFLLIRKPPGDFKGNGVVTITKPDGQYRLTRNGSPYFIKGVCVLNANQLRSLKERGANSIRVYSSEGAGPILDSAHALGMSVLLGIQLPFAMKEADYSDEAVQASLVSKVREEVNKYKDHPALLMWGLGNEVDLFVPFELRYLVTTYQTWKVVDQLARMIHELDPAHPITTTIPEGDLKVNFITAITRNIDLMSLNTFSPFNERNYRIKDRLGLTGLNGPYLLAEYGNEGYWLSERTEWYSKIEKSSREKSDYIIANYNRQKNDSAKCLGSYAFLWGYKNELTPTWFSLLTKDGQETEVTSALEYVWTGKKAAIRNSSIRGLTLNEHPDATNTYVTAAQPLRIKIQTTGEFFPDQSVCAEVRDEAEYLTASYAAREQAYYAFYCGNLPIRPDTGRIVKTARDKYELSLQAPERKGAYRLYLYIGNPTGSVSTANIPFYVLDAD